jgi:hypothetical protein
MLLAVFAGSLCANATVSSIFKEPIKGKITKLDTQGRIEVTVEGQEIPERVPLDEVEEILFNVKGDERKPEDAPVRVYLLNGDILYGTPDTHDDEDETDLFKFTGDRCGELVISVDHVKRIEVVANAAPGDLPQLTDEEDEDVTYFTAFNGMPAQRDPDSSLVRVVKEGAYLYNEALHDENYDGKMYAWNRLRGVITYRGEYENYEKLMGIFTLRDGSILRGPITKWQGGKVTLEHQVLETEITLDESSLLAVTMKNGRYAYVSDLELAEEPEERPYFLPSDFKYEDYLFKMRRDQAQGGGSLSIRGKVYAKGIGVHAMSKLTFDLNKGYRRFVSDIGVDDSAGNLASVEFKVYADGKLVYESGVLRRSGKVKQIDIEVLNVSELVLEVTAADNADIQDRANWANAKLVR